MTEQGSLGAESDLPPIPNVTQNDLDELAVWGVNPQPPMTYKVVLEEIGGDKVVFEASSPVTESRAAAYDTYGITHLPTDIFAYRSTSARSFSISGRLVSRTTGEANANARYLNLIRQWLLPDFGDSGATPPILYLSAYSNDNIRKLKVLLRSYHWSFPDDVDYIFTGMTPMPVIGQLGIEVVEAYSPAEVTARVWKIRDNKIGGMFEGGNIPGASSKSLASSMCDASTPMVWIPTVAAVQNNTSPLANSPLAAGASFPGITGEAASGAISEVTTATGQLSQFVTGGGLQKTTDVISSGISGAITQVQTAMPAITEGLSSAASKLAENAPQIAATAGQLTATASEFVASVTPQITSLGGQFSSAFANVSNPFGRSTQQVTPIISP